MLLAPTASDDTVKQRLTTSAAALAFVSALITGACVPTESPPSDRPDGGLKPTDAGPVDAGAADTGAVDAAGPDAGAAPDADPPDSGPLPDRDRDGIPDVEDPEPDRANPQLLADDFDTADGDWIFSSVTMAIDPAASVLEVDRIEPFEREGWIGPRPAWADYYVRARIRVNDVGTSDDTRSGHAGLIARVGQVTPSRYVTCGIDLKLGRVVLAEHEGSRRTTLGEAPSPDRAGEWLPLGFSAVRNAYVCEIGGVRVEGASAVFRAGSVGFRSYDATFAADWIEVYEILP